jgi:hypothetical protein
MEKKTFKVVFGSMERKNEFNISIWFFYNLGSGFKTCLPITNASSKENNKLVKRIKYSLCLKINDLFDH